MIKTPEQIKAEKLFKKISRKLGTTMREHQLIGEGDHVIVGLSGGKDSMIMLEALSERKRALPFHFDLSAAHVEAEGIGYSISKDRMQEFCDKLGVALHFRSISPDLDKDPSNTACFICSWQRRKELFTLTRDLDCNKLALGHHRRDAVETLLLNMMYHGSISSLPYQLSMFERRVELIRPLMDLDEGLLIEYAALNKLVQVDKSCPHENRTQREQISALIDRMEEIHGPSAYNIFKSMDKIFDEYLPLNKDNNGAKA